MAHSKPSYGVGGGKLKLPNNLPDVLPLGVKLHQQTAKLPATPSSPGEVAVQLRYGSNNNLATKSPTNATPNGTAYAMIYGQAPVQQQQQQRYSTPALGHAYSRSPAPQFTRSQSYDVKQQQHNDPAQFMSQSHVDLKQVVHDLETTLEEVLPETPPRLSPATSDCSLSKSSLECSPVNANHHSPNPNPNSNSNSSAEAHIFRAELISTTTPTATLPKPMSMTTPTPTPPPTVSRQESLRENIEKITQLQSQLMSAHLCDTGILSYASKQLPATPAGLEPVLEPAALPPSLPAEPAPELDSPPTSPTSADSLKLLQRSELVLMVNPMPSTADMACQTEEHLETELEATREEQQTRTTLQPRQRQAIELEYELLAMELIRQLPANDKLIEILTPKSCKPTTQYVSNLYNPNVPLRPAKRDVGTSTLMRMKAAGSTTITSSLGSTVEQLQQQVVSVELQLNDETNESEATSFIKSKLVSKCLKNEAGRGVKPFSISLQDELIKQLDQKIGALKREQQTIGDECAINDKLGLDLLDKLTEKVRPSEASKFRTYIADVGHITSLLLSLSERLAQTEASLEVRPPSSQQEKVSSLPPHIHIAVPYH